MKVKSVIFRILSAICALGAAACTAFLLVCVCTGEKSDLSTVVNTDENLYMMLAIMLGLTAAGLMSIPFFLLAGRRNLKFRKTGKICASLTAGLAIAVAVCAVIPVCFPEIDSTADCEKEPQLYIQDREITDDGYPVYSSAIGIVNTSKNIYVSSSPCMTEITASFYTETEGNITLVSVLCTVKDSDAKLMGTVSIPLTEELIKKFSAGKEFYISLYIPENYSYFYDFAFYWISDEEDVGVCKYEITNTK